MALRLINGQITDKIIPIMAGAVYRNEESKSMQTT